MPNLTEVEKDLPTYNPSDKVKKLISSIWMKWQDAYQQRLSSYRFFGDRNFVEYVNDSVDRFNGYLPPRTDPAKDWGAKVFNNITRAKTVAIIAQITAERVRAEFFGQNQDNETDKIAAEIIKKLEGYTYYKNQDDEQQFYAVFEAVIKGTCIGYEGYKVDRRKIKEIIEYDPDTGEIKFEDKEILDWNDVYGEVIPLFNFYPGNIFVRDVQKQPFIFWRDVLDYDVAKADFEKYPNWKYVQPHTGQMQETSDDINSESGSDDVSTTYVSESVREGQVEILRYFNKWTDEFHIVINGVLMTPYVSPLPWDHKDYPFWKTIFEPFDGSFFYGKSLPDKLRDNQDVLNALYEMALDQTYLSINPPIMTNGIENIKDERLYPGRRIIVDDLNQSKVLEMPAVQKSHFDMMNMVEESMKRDSIDDPSAGSSGSRTTAFEIGVAKEAAQKLLSVFLRTLEWSVRHKTELRVSNILQFYRIPMITTLIGEEETLEYRKIVLDETELADGTKGTQVVQVMGPDEAMPTTEEITKAELWYMAKGQNIAFSFISTEKLKALKLKIQIIPNSSLKMSEVLRRALELDYQQKAALLYPDLLNRVEGFKALNEAFDKDNNKLSNPQNQNMGIQPGGPPGGVQPNETPASGPSMSTPNSAATAGVPNANTAQNSARNIPA